EFILSGLLNVSVATRSFLSTKIVSNMLHPHWLIGFIYFRYPTAIWHGTSENLIQRLNGFLSGNFGVSVISNTARTAPFVLT
ncbi:MAG: hypothetical protein KAT75_02870, partial [Dehalococcoidia bacterium]|nr:hypothetical protein [Dehalococcoidia bacterium]